tara:strand:- start:817 stop:1425 length:609 start_codon:yes stop_codon:yes gene_type:complete
MIRIDKYFPTLIGVSRLDMPKDLKNKAVKKCMALKNTINSGGQNWLSKNTYNTLGTFNFLKDKDFDFISSFIKKEVADYCNKLKIDFNRIDMEPDMAWFNIYKKGDYQEYHVHNDSALSVVYFLDGPPNSSRIFFKTPINPLSKIPYIDYYDDTFKTLHYDMQPGLLLIFDSSLEHAVEQHIQDEPRISLATNFNVKNENHR